MFENLETPASRRKAKIASIPREIFRQINSVAGQTARTCFISGKQRTSPTHGKEFPMNIKDMPL